MYQDIVTLFNRYDSRLGDMWFPTVLHNVNLNIDKAAITEKYGADSTDNASLHIRFKEKDKEIFIEDKRYLLPKEWDKQVNDDLANTITLSSGEKFDFFYVGEWEDTSPIKDDDYITGCYDYMNKTYDEVFSITSVAKYRMIPHFEVMAK